MTTRSKGSRIQRKLIEELQKVGFIASKVEQTGRFVKQKDLFGLFDICAIDSDGTIHFIQVTCNKPHTHKEYQKFAEVINPQAVISQWVWYDRRGWKKFFYQKGSKTYVSDERVKIKR